MAKLKQKNTYKKPGGQKNSADKNKQREKTESKKLLSFKFFKGTGFAGKVIRRGVIFFAVIVVLFCVLLANYSISSIDRKNMTVLVDIPTGSSFLKVTETLHQAGLIKSRILFYSLTIIKNARRHIRAGEYEFNTSLTPSAMIDKLLRGEIKIHKVIIREDLSLREIVVLLDTEKLINKEDFFELACDEEFLKSLNIKADSLEGYLFPDTYYLDRSMSTRQIVKAMVNQFWKKVTPEMIKRAGEKRFNIHQLVTFASIIGKESGNDAEKPLISAVFYNRLKKRMPLQSDPTAVYDLDNFEGKILRSHLKRKSPFNTYVIRGLPPGPIANPGVTSLKAVLYPASVNYLYFVSKKDGTHFFSSSLAEHKHAINRYRYINN
ncbi:MAG: endolytic transglycosylase MltG [Deltaproteobacteria bacterium]|nr:endolytic transglycosylase MltG [Deltaproteobacteria bacterium]